MNNGGSGASNLRTAASCANIASCDLKHATQISLVHLTPPRWGLPLLVPPPQIKLWSVSALSDDPGRQQLGYLLSDIFLAAVSVTAALGFLLYGGRLIFMLQRFPIESRGRRRKLWEVGLVTSICAGCFSLRCVVVWCVQLHCTRCTRCVAHDVLASA